MAQPLQVAVLLVLCTTTTPYSPGKYGSYYTTNKARHTIRIDGERSKRSILDAGLTIGESVSAALGIYDSVKAEFHANLLSEISNYSKWPLSNAQYNIIHGETSELPLFIRPGFTEGFTIQQKDGRQYIEGLTAWTASPGYFCMFYWRVEGRLLFGKKGNLLGVGCAEENKTFEDFTHEIANAYDEEETTHLNFLRFTDNVQVKVQFCTEHLCVQAICGSSHQTKASVFVLPIKTENLAEDLKEEITQDELDSLIADTECKIFNCQTEEARGWAALSLTQQIFTILGVSVLSTIVIAVFIIGCYKFLPSNQNGGHTSAR